MVDRRWFGGGAADWTMTRGDGGLAVIVPGQTLVMWSAQVGGTSYEDLLDEQGQPITSVTSIAEPTGGGDPSPTPVGTIPPFQGPAGITRMWADGGGGTRFLLAATDLGDAIDDKLDLSGGTMTGTLRLVGDIPAASTTYVETALASVVLDVTAPAYGATGDGTTNDAGAIQAALNAARDAGGGWVFVPPGTYKVATLPLRIYRNTRLTLAPGAVIKRGGNGTILLNGDASQTLGGYTGHGNILIEGGTWDCQAAAYPTSAMCISVGHAEGITIRDTLIKDVCGYHAIEINSTKTARITNVRALGFLDPGGRTFSEAIQIDLAKSSDAFGGFGPYDDTVCQDVVVEGCTVGASGSSGTTAWPRGVGSHSTSPDRPHTGIRV
ncbi:glycoside hydrolase family 55 protein, partial [Actinomadura sp. RB99]|uniref:glycoside hydrolase family 55 protein n=1 Tax=Actinomadura sp. RB99 TaxID=2691577 RepID=UPI001F50B2FB